MNLFGKYNTALECANATKNREGIKYPDNETYFKQALEMYISDNYERKCQLLSNFDLSFKNTYDTTPKSASDCIVLIDGSNISYGKNIEPGLDNVVLVDKYLQDKGFKKENISIIVDATFPYKCNIEREEFWEFRNNDKRYSLAPAGQQADVFILTKAYELYKKDPNNPPIIITNDKYEDHFTKHPELKPIKSRKKGVTWTYIQKKPQPIINFWD